jgi:excisionase family DNA binding protein
VSQTIASATTSGPSTKKYKTTTAAEYLGISKWTLLDYCKRRLIGYQRYRGGFVFRQADLDAFEARTYIPAIQKRAA